MRTLALATFLLLLAACGKDEDTTTITTDQGSVTVNTEAGQSLPAAFPKDVFLPDGYTVRSSMDLGGTIVVDLEAPGATADVFGQAGKAMPGQGWKQTAAVQATGQSLLVFENTGRTVQYSFMDDLPGKTHVAVQVITAQP